MADRGSSLRRVTGPSGGKSSRADSNDPRGSKYSSSVTSQLNSFEDLLDHGAMVGWRERGLECCFYRHLKSKPTERVSIYREPLQLVRHGATGGYLCMRVRKQFHNNPKPIKPG